MDSEWAKHAKGIPLRQVASALGLTVKRAGIGPCPSCGASKRGSSDRRPPLYVNPHGGWTCVRCDETGDAINLAALIVGQGRQDYKAARAWYVSQRWIPGDDDPAAFRVPRLPRPPAPEPVDRPQRLDVAQVHQLWDDLARDPLADPATAEWLKRRETLADHWRMLGHARDYVGYPPDLVRAIRPDARALPPWATFHGRSWAESGHRLVFPCFDAVGELVALRARYVGHASDVPKEVSPRGPGATRGTVYADWMARAVLQTENAKPGELADPTGRRWDGRVLVLEGGPCWLRFCLDLDRWALRPGCTEDPERVIPDDWHGPAMVGVWSGAWPAGPLGEQLAERFKHARAVIVATDDDKDGDKYAAAILKTCKAVGVAAGRANKTKRETA